MSQGDNTRREVLARRGADDLAIIGPTRFDVLGIRLAEGEEGANPTNGAAADDAEADQGSDNDTGAQGAEGGESAEDDDDDEGFDGEFDAKRARRTINRLRRQRRAALDAASKAKDDPEVASLRSENLRLKVAMRLGLDVDLADRLRGNTEEELMEDAQTLLDRFYPDAEKPKPRQPKPALRGGTQPDKEPELSADDIVKAALAR